MFSMIGGIFRLFGLLLLSVLLASCGGGGGGDDGGFTGEKINVTMVADKTTLQTNPLNFAPNPSSPFTNTITVQIKRSGSLFNAPSVSIDIVSGLASGALFYLDGKAEHQQCPTGATCPPTAPVDIAYRRVTYADTTGVVTSHFHSSGTPGTVFLRGSVADPGTGQLVSSDLTITVGPGVSTGQPAVVGMIIPTTPLYITGQGQQDVEAFQIEVLDDANQPVPNPAGNNNLRLQMLPNRPNGGEKLVAITASGATQQGEIVNTRTINGVAAAALHSGTLPGTVQIVAIADRADNNVDNGIQDPVTDLQTIAISSGEIASLTFTGPYPGAVAQRFNTLPLGDGDTIDFATGVYSRAISVVAADEFGNPPAPGKFITFRLMDGPMTGYPNLGRGTFTIAGADGNPQEGGNTFTTPSTGSSLAGASVNCQLVLEGNPDQIGGWIVTGVSGQHLLSVNNPFNLIPDTGFTVPYTVGCAPYAGNVANNPGGVTVSTDADGLASTYMNYPITQLGRNFKMTVEANGGQVGAVLSGWYLGIPTASTLNVVPVEDLNLTVAIGGTLTKALTLQLFDGGNPPAPLPAEVLDVRVVITDPDHSAFLAAENAVVVAEAAIPVLEAAQTAAQAALTNAGCAATAPTPPAVDPPQCPALRTALTAATAALDAAKADLLKAQTELAKAEARDALYSPTATYIPKPLVTGVNGIATMTITVSDLYTGASTGGTGNSQVQFFVSTVGPEIIAPTITITVKPQP